MPTSTSKVRRQFHHQSLRSSSPKHPLIRQSDLVTFFLPSYLQTRQQWQVKFEHESLRRSLHPFLTSVQKFLQPHTPYCCRFVAELADRHLPIAIKFLGGLNYRCKLHVGWRTFPVGAKSYKMKDTGFTQQPQVNTSILRSSRCIIKRPIYSAQIYRALASVSSDFCGAGLRATS